MSATSRAKVTIEELKKLFSKGRKPSEEDFAKLIDTLNDEVEEGTYYTQDEINVIVEKLASTDDLNTLSDLMEELEYIVGGKANEVHSHIEYVKINHSLTDEDITDMFLVLRGVKTIEEVLAEAKNR